MGWLRVVTLAVVAALSMGVAAQEQYQEGVHYELIEPAIHAGISDRVVVTEFFSYGCGHCYNFEPLLESFESRLPDGVVVQRTPVIWNNNSGMKLLAKTYYAVEVLDVFEPVHGAVFNPFTVSVSVYPVLKPFVPCLLKMVLMLRILTAPLVRSASTAWFVRPRHVLRALVCKALPHLWSTESTGLIHDRPVARRTC